MIYFDSRYSDGNLSQVYKPSSNNYQQIVYRNWPSYNVDYFFYLVNEVERVDNISALTLGSGDVWWQIMDINPEILNPFEIPAGTLLRIPKQ